MNFIVYIVLLVATFIGVEGFRMKTQYDYDAIIACWKRNQCDATPRWRETCQYCCVQNTSSNGCTFVPR